jgi:hypothetical protein
VSDSISGISGDALPLLGAGTYVAVSYSDPTPEAAAIVDQAFGELISAGVNAYELNLTWADLEPSPGVIDTMFLRDLLNTLQSADLTPYFVVKTIDSVRLRLPSDLIDAGDSRKLADNRHFNDPVILDRLQAMLEQVVPVLMDFGGFFIALGNEIDPWLMANPEEVQPFLEFVQAGRTYIQSIAPQMGVGVNLTYEGVLNGFSATTQFLTLSDAASFSYYPLNADFTPKDPRVVSNDMATMVQLAGALPVLIQETGYPSGYLPTPRNNSSTEKQRQFVENLFSALRTYPQIRVVSYQHLADWQASECAAFSDYYGTSVPTFQEYLCTLGLLQDTGETKSAYTEFLSGLRQL